MPLHMPPLIPWPILTNSDYDAVLRVMRSGRLTGGDEAKLLAHEWSRYMNVAHCLCVSSCTHALHLALRAVGVQPGDEVIVPALTFCGTTASIIHCGAMPVFADVDSRTFNIDPADVARKLSARTRAIVPVHLHGLPCDIDKLTRFALGIPIVEDACQAHGATINGVKVGSLGAIGCFSLNQVKPLGGGQGGLVVTQHEGYAKLVGILASHGSGDHVGYSYGITELAAAIVRSQLQSLDEHNQRARSNAHRLSQLLIGLEDLVPREPNGVQSTWHKYRLRLPEHIDPNNFVQTLTDQGVPADRWPGSLVPQRSEYRRYATDNYPIAEHVHNHSAIIGSEQFPLASQRAETMDQWAEVILKAL